MPFPSRRGHRSELWWVRNDIHLTSCVAYRAFKLSTTICGAAGDPLPSCWSPRMEHGCGQSQYPHSLLCLYSRGGNLWQHIFPDCGHLYSHRKAVSALWSTAVLFSSDSPTPIMQVLAARMPLADHVATAGPYAILVGLVSLIIGDVGMGLGLYGPFAALGLVIATQTAFLGWFGRKVN